MDKVYKISYRIFIIYSFIFTSLSSFGQSNLVDDEVYKLKRAYPIPTFNKTQMYEDFDSLINIYKCCNAQLEVRKQVTKTDIIQELYKLRNEIDTITMSQDFILLLYRALRISQDAHCQIGSNIWFYRYSMYKKYTKEYDDETYGLTFNYSNLVNRKIKRFLKLKYVNNKYYLLYPLSICRGLDTVIITEGTEIKSINGLKILNYINKFKDIQIDLRWDFNKNHLICNSLRMYSDYKVEFLEFYNSKGLYKIDSINCIHQDLKVSSTVGYKRKSFIKYFPKDSTLFVRLPIMSSYEIKYFRKEIPKYKDYSVKKVIIDIRGNYGGDDRAWISLLQQILNKSIKINIYYLSNDNEVCADFIKKKGLSKKKNLITPDWDKNNKYNIALNIIDKVNISKKSLKFDGKIYVIQDEDIYSSASCLSSLCLQHDNLISIGRSNGQLGGQGIEAMPFRLPNSKMIVLMDILIDNSNAKTARDVYHSEVEIPIELPIEYYIDRIHYKGDVYSKEYLYDNDLLFQEVINFDNP